MNLPFHLLIVALMLPRTAFAELSAVTTSNTETEERKEPRLRRKRRAALDVTPFFMNSDYAISDSNDKADDTKARKLQLDEEDSEEDAQDSRLRPHGKKKNLLDVTPFMLEAHGNKDSILMEDDEDVARELQNVMSMDPTPAPSADDVPTPVPSMEEVPTPAPSTDETPTRAPTSGELSCNPTTGPCIDNFQDLQAIANNAEQDDVVAVCGGTITTTAPVVIQRANVKLCCEEDASQDCVLTGSGGHRNLIAVGSSLTLQGINFFNGQAPQDDGAPVDGNAGGGNVVIDASGNHTIEKCAFYNGLVDDNARYGGNLFVKTPDSVVIRNSLFVNGSAFLGGGAAVWNAINFSCIDSEFRDNTGSGVFSGNLDEDLRDPGQTILYESSTFNGNTGDYGGGFLASGIGSMPSLSLFNCVFDENVASIDGGAGAVFPDTDAISLFIMDNEGQDNVAEEGFCADFQVFRSSGEECYAVESEVFIEGGEGEA